MNINYRRSSLVGDVLLIKSQLKKIGKSSFVLSQDVYDKYKKAIIADAMITFCVFDNKIGSQKGYLENCWKNYPC